MRDTTEHERGLSPVIGVILMVAITVLLAATVATFFLGFGTTAEKMQTPTVTFSFDYRLDGNGQALAVSHMAGETLDPERTQLVITGAVCKDPGGTAANPNGRYTFTELGLTGDTVMAGDTVLVDEGHLCGGGDYLVLDEAVVSVVWTRQSRSTEFITWRGPSA